MNSSMRIVWRNSEWLPIFGFTIVGAFLRCMHLGQLGLDHFDEGVYGSAGAWIHLPRGLADLDPGLIPYAPPAFPILLGLAYSLLGTTDFAAVVVSVLAGIATIPVVGWLGRRWMGPGCGAPCSAFAALSGIHIAFSRMALTDSMFLLTWIIGMAAGAEFLSRPNLLRAIVLGVAVGLAQLTKYNGWLVGAIVVTAFFAGVLLQREEWSRPRTFRTLAWGGLACILAFAVYWPWYRFVESRFGYSSLVNHQRSYLGELTTWPGHLMIQLNQLVALSGGANWGLVATALSIGAIIWSLRIPWNGSRTRLGFLFGTALVLIRFFPTTSGWWLGVILAGLLLQSEDVQPRMIGAWWLVLTVLTPLYHPYARLWLPLEAVGWMLKALFLRSAVLLVLGKSEPFVFDQGTVPRLGLDRLRVLKWGVVPILVVATLMIDLNPRRPIPLPGLLGPRDSFRIATARILAQIPPNVGFVRLLGRPTLRYYVVGPLSNRGVGTVRESSLDELLRPGEGWALVDTALLRQEDKYEAAIALLTDRCLIVAQEVTELSPATLLDIDSNAATGSVLGRRESLLLVRHKRPGDSL